MKKKTKERSQDKYNKEHTKVVPLRLNKRTDQDILYKLEEVESMAGYIKSLIREDIEKYGIDKNDK